MLTNTAHQPLKAMPTVGRLSCKKKSPKQHLHEAAAHFSEFKQNRPPHREVRGPILAKRGSYFLFSKGRAKTNQA
jgi:hypothetical protein